MVIEVTFPRGGRGPPKQKPVSKEKYVLFNNKKKPKMKKIDLRNEMGPKNFVEKTVCPEEITQVSADLLTYQSIKEGMIVMGCVREVQKMSLSILLPGRLSGRVMITQISEPYTKLLKSIANNYVPPEYRQIKQIFRPGQYVATKVMKFQEDDTKAHLSLSLCPHDVNSDLNYKSIGPGMLLWGSISCCEDHGYVIDLGVKNCRAFLPKANAEIDYVCGEVLWCVVQKSEVTNTVSTVTLNALKEKISTTKIINDLSLDYLLPGMQVDVTVSKILNNGLEVKFLNDYTGYIHENYLKNNFEKLSSHKIGNIITARVLYITPITKLTFLTLRCLEAFNDVQLSNGTILTGTILSVTKGGLYLKLKKKLKGYVSFKRLQLKLNSDLDYTEQLKKNYPIGSNQQCRVLNYDCMENLYICTMEKELLKETIFTYNDLKIGEDITVEIREIQPNGLLIQAGRVEGYILNEHLTDSILSNYTNIKSKYHVGQKVKGKVWNVNEASSLFHVTLKPSFLKTEHILTSYESAEYNKQYPGIIVQITKNGVLVKFFGDVKGWVPHGQLSYEKVSRPDSMFKIGQVVVCKVIKSVGNKLSLSFQPPKTKNEKKKLQIGQRVDVKVTQVLSNALEVKTLDNVMAVVPSQHLTHTPSLAEVLMKTYKVDDVLNGLVCINIRNEIPILSLRERDIETVPKLSNLQENDIIRCSVINTNEKRLLLHSPIKDFQRLINVSPENVSDIPVKLSLLDFKKNQCLLTKITEIKRKEKIICGTTKLSDVWDGNLDTARQLLIKYIIDTQQIHTRLTEDNHPLVQHKLGDSVSGTISRINRSGTITINISDNLKGIIDSKHSIPGLKLKQQISGIVFNINYIKNCLELTINPVFINKINQKQTGIVNIKPGKVVTADVLLVKKECVVVSLRGNGNKQIAYLPTRLHVNDLSSNISNYQIGDEIRIEIFYVENGFILGVANELIKNFRQAIKVVKRARISSESSDDGNAKKKKVKPTSVVEEIIEQNAGEEVEKKKRKRRKRKLEKTEKEDENIVPKKSKGSTDDKEEINEESSEENEEEDKKVQEESSESESEDECQEEINTKESEIQSILSEREDKKVQEESSESESEDECQERVNTKESEIQPILSGVSNFWENPSQEQPDEESSEEEEEVIEDLSKKQKKKKLTPAERAELARQEEEKLRKIETELADAEADPKTADQFDRVVLANPNDSMLWIKYIAFHLEATEIEKARAIARKALNTIEFRQEQDKLNVWIAFLNLENRYGTKESFTNILEEAVKMNDSLTVHLQALNILSESRKINEFLELLSTVTKRYKQESKMWTGAAEACYKCEEKEQARNLMQCAIKSLQEKQHINVIVQFAFMESKWGEPERSEALLEKILASYPKRVDVWCSYIDMLVKGNRIHIAKNVLERAVSQKLPPRKMKTLFTKFVQFETKYGDKAGVKRVRQMAEDYVKNALN